MLPTPSDRFGPDAASESSGRHRRPETLADTTRWRPASAAGSAAGSAAASVAASAAVETAASASAVYHPADELIRQARKAAGRAAYIVDRPASITPATRHHRRRATTQRGRHAKPVERDPLAITVRPISAVRDWAREPGDRPPVTGSHRAPGTLPIESWLLIGKARQQALLASLVAVGLALVMIPAATQRTVDPITAAGNSTETTAPGKAPTTGHESPPQDPGKPSKPERDEPAKPKPPASTPADAPPPSKPAVPSEAPIIVVPAGDGPHQSLRTTGSEVVALTFDDGPDPVQTPKILALLEKYQVKATFCLVGTQVERHPDIVRDIVRGGHALCNHTWDHSLIIGKKSPAMIESDLYRTNMAIRDAAPDAPVPFFRAPGGNFTDRLVQVAYKGGMTSLYWEVDPRDWDHKPTADDVSHTDRIVTEVKQSVKPGAIVLSHDFNQPDTVAAYEKLLPELSETFELGLPDAHEPPADN